MPRMILNTSPVREEKGKGGGKDKMFHSAPARRNEEAHTIQAGGIKSVLERRHFVQDTAKGPDIRLGAIRAILAHLWAHVQGRPDGGARHLHGVVQHLGNAKVTLGDHGTGGHRVSGECQKKR